MKIDTPRLAHELAYAAAWDAVSRQQRARMAAGRARGRVPAGLTPLRMTAPDRALFLATVQKWYSHFSILNAHQWMPAGFAWRKVRGSWQPVRVS